MRRALPLVAFLALSPSARADDPSPEDGSLDDAEAFGFASRAHTVEVSFADGVARLRVRRTFENAQDVATSLSVGIPLPGAAVIDGFRVDTGGGFVDGALAPLDTAEADYQRLLHIGTPPARQPAPPALLFHSARDNANLMIPIVAPGGRVSFEFSIVAPTCYKDGRFYIDYPLVGGEVPRVRGRGVRVEAEDAAREDGEVGLPTEVEELPQMACHGSHAFFERRLILSHVGPSAGDVRWGTTYVGAREIGRLEFELPTIAPAPRGASIVFVLDGSRSARDFELAGQLELVRAIAEQLPGSRVQIVVYRRRAAALFSRFVSGDRLPAAIAALAAKTFDEANGSNLDAGIALAAELLAPRRGPKRIVAMTDDRLRAAFSPSEVAALVAQSGALVHLVDYQRGDGELFEFTASGHRLEPIAFANGGAMVTIQGPPGDDQRAREITRHLVSPIRIDAFTIEGPPGLTRAIESVALGGGMRGFDVAASLPKRVGVSGWLWGKQWRRLATRSERASALVGRLAVGDFDSLGLDESELAPLALANASLSRETSFLAAGGPVTVEVDYSGGGTSMAST